MSKKKKRNHQQYVLYIKHSIFDPYVPVGVFKSSHDAHKHLDETYRNFPHKIMSLRQAKELAKKVEAKKKRAQAKRKEFRKKARTYLAGVGQNFYENQQRGFGRY